MCAVIVLPGGFYTYWDTRKTPPQNPGHELRAAVARRWQGLGRPRDDVGDPAGDDDDALNGRAPRRPPEIGVPGHHLPDVLFPGPGRTSMVNRTFPLT